MGTSLIGAASGENPTVSLTIQRGVPIRSAPQVPDSADPERIALVRNRWNSQDVLLAARDRQIEENVRMLAGRQWEVWSPHLGKHVDLTAYMSDSERAWRQRPVINFVFHWFVLTRARLSENSPIVGFAAATADLKDAHLAEVMDPIYKTLWRECGMDEAHDRLVAWMCAGGEGYIKSRVDFTKGRMIQLPGEPMVDPATGGPMVDEMGNVVQGPPTEEPEGQLTVDVLSPMECRGTWDAQPWHLKPWHIQRSFLRVSDVEELYGVRVQPDPLPFSGQGHNTHILTRILFGAGNFGSGTGRETMDGGLGGANREKADPNDSLVAVDEMWEKPSKVYPQGRLLIVSRESCLWDSARPFNFKAASPIRQFPFLTVPGRQNGTTPQEFLNPLNKAYNRGAAQIMEHRALMCNPLMEVDALSGLTEEELTSRPGAMLLVNKRPGVQAIEFRSPPMLSSDVWKTQGMLVELIDRLGNIHGGMGQTPTSDASGELVEQLRVNSDRFTTPTAKRLVIEYARMIEDWMAILPVLWPVEKFISYAGEDNVTRTLTVLPAMFEGMVNVVPDIESMLPETQGERRKRVERFFQMGVFGNPADPMAQNKFLEQSRFPHLSRLSRPGGVDRVLAEQLLGELLRGRMAVELPLYPQYDAMIHGQILRDFIASTDFLKIAPEVQQQIMLRFQAVERLGQTQMMAQLQSQATAAALAPPPEAGAAPPAGPPA